MLKSVFVHVLFVCVAAVGVMLHSSVMVSISPISSVQEGRDSADHSEWHGEWIKIKDMVFAAFFQEKDTELTAEQTAYLNVHENRILAKGEGVLYNIQEYIDSINNTTSLQKRSNPNREFNNITTSLKLSTNLDKENLNYGDLADKWKDKVYENDSGVIIQINDRGYSRYMQIINITGRGDGDKIHVHAPKKDFTMSNIAFKNFYLNNENFNIIIVHNDNDVSTVLHHILTSQRDDLYALNTRYNSAMTSCGLFTTLGLSGIYLLVFGDVVSLVKDQPYSMLQEQKV